VKRRCPLATGREAFHVLAVVDDKETRKRIESALKPDAFRVAWCRNGKAGLKKVTEERTDLAVIDEQLPGESGTDLMMKLCADPETRDIPVLYICGAEDRAMLAQAPKLADDFILRPFKKLEFEVRARRILDRMHGCAGVAPLPARAIRERIAVHLGDDIYLVPLDQVYYFEASGKYAYANAGKKRFLTGSGIGELEERLRPSGKFLRIHRSFIINIDSMFKITRDPKSKMVIVMADDKGTELRVSDSYLQDVKKKLGV
jgi:two-component system LytT family response regulator